MILTLWPLAFAQPTADDEGPPTEEALLERVEAGEYLRARVDAEALLAQNPGSLVGHFALGMALWKGEADLGHARAELIEAKEIYEDLYPDNTDDDPWKIHADTLESLVWVAAEMDERQEQLTWIDLYNDRFDPDLTVERAWALMKLDRFDEARAVATAGTETEDEWKQSAGYNTLCAIAGEAGQREANYEACLRALEHERASAAPDPTVDAYNAALGALRTLRFDEAEALIRESAGGAGQDAANPYTVLLGYYLGAGRGEEAVQALVEMRRFNLRMPPTMRAQGRAEGDATLATLLLVAGEGERAQEILTRAIEQPDRMGMDSANAEQASGGYAALRLVARRLTREQAREHASAGPWWERALDALDRALPDPEAWADRARVRGSLSDARRLDRTLRIVLHGGIFLPTWLLPELGPLLGPGVCRAVLEEARQEAQLEDVAPWYDAFEAELAWREDDLATAERLGRGAVDALPRAENLLRARAAAVAADAAWRQGRADEALALYTTVLQLEPGVLRRLELALPARIQGDGPLGEAVAERLARSPRLEPYPRGFVVQVSGGDAPTVCLRDPTGALLSCTEPVPAPSAAEGAPPPDDDAHARAVVDAFHARAFAMPLGLSKIDLNSLDGATAVAAEARRKAVEELLGGLSEP